MLILTVLSFSDSPAQKKQLNKKLQTGCTISVTVADSISGKPVDLANVVLLNKEDSTMVAGAVSDSTGKTQFNHIQPGSYFILSSFIGYHQKSVSPVVISEKDNLIKIDTLFISPKTLSLKPVHVVAEKERVVYEDDKIIYNVEKDIMNLGGSALEVLNNAPLITVDFNGGIKMLGRKTVSIFIDGIPVRNMGNTEDVLRTIPYNEIDRIEIVTNPGIEFGAFIEGGVVNIILKKDTNTKYSGSINGGSTINHSMKSSASMKYKLDNGNVGARVYLSYYNTDSEEWMDRETTTEEKTTFLNQQRENNHLARQRSWSFNHLYKPDDKNTFSQSLMYTPRNNSENNSKTYNKYSDSYMNLINEYNSNINRKSNLVSLSYSMNYNRSFEKKGQKLSLSGFYRNNLNNSSGIQFNQYNTGEELFKRQDSYYYSKTSSFNIKLSYSHPFDEDNNLGVSYQFDNSRLRQNNNYWDLRKNEFLENLSLKSIKETRENDHFIGLSYSGKVLDFKYRLNLGANKLKRNYREEVNKNTFEYNRWSLTPAVSLTKRLDKSHMFTANWSRSEFAPQNYQIEAMNDYSDSTSITLGNTKLTPVQFVAYRLEYSYHKPNISIMAGISYDRMWDLIENYTLLLNENTTVTSYRNVGKEYSYGLFLGADNTLFDVWTLSFSGHIEKEKIFNTTAKYKEVTYYGQAETQLKLSGFGIQLRLQYVPARSSVQSEQHDYYYLDLYTNMTLIDKRLFVSAGVSDILKTMEDNSTKHGAGFISRRGTNTTTRLFLINISYYFQDTETPEGDSEG